MKLKKEYPYEAYDWASVRVIIDTDCACEADDPFAVAHALLTKKFDIKAINAANFAHEDGSVQKSYDAINKLLDAMELTGQVPVLKGAHPMKAEDDYEENEASDFIIEEALKDDPRPLFVAVQGAITNVAIAVRKRPEIAKKIVCIWIGGAPYPKGGWEFNLINDVVAARIIMESEIVLWQVPRNAYSMMLVTFSTLHEHLSKAGKPGKYLLDQLWEFNKNALARRRSWGSSPNATTQELADSCCLFACGECWALGDSPVVGLMMSSRPDDRVEIGAPYINDDGTYTLRPDHPHRIGVYQRIDSQFILHDFFYKMKFQYGED